MDDLFIGWLNLTAFTGLCLAVWMHIRALDDQFAADLRPLPKGWWE